MSKRKVVVSLAVSADGFIARKDGSVDWLDRPRTAGDYGMGKFVASIDTIVMGRNTYDVVLRFLREGKTIPRMPGVKHYVFSRKLRKKVVEGFEYANEPIGTFVKRLRAQKGKNIWMMGGGG